MKSLTVFLLVFLSFNAKAEDINLDFWDGTFAYNRLAVESVPHQSSLVNLQLSGSTLNLARQLDGIDNDWATRDLLDVFLSKEDCDINKEAKTVSCFTEKTSVHQLRWTLNHKLTKSYSGIIENLRIEANRGRVSVSFRVPSDEFFSPHQENIQVDFSFFPR